MRHDPGPPIARHARATRPNARQEEGTWRKRDGSLRPSPRPRTSHSQHYYRQNLSSSPGHFVPCLFATFRGFPSDFSSNMGAAVPTPNNLMTAIDSTPLPALTGTPDAGSSVTDPAEPLESSHHVVCQRSHLLPPTHLFATTKFNTAAQD